jgi:hypothetical protein
VLTPEKQARLNSFFTYTSRIANVNVNLEKTVNRYFLDIEVANSIKPLTIERFNLVQDILSFSDIFDFIKIKVPTEPLQININTSGSTVTVIPTEQYTFIVNETVTNFLLKISNLPPITLTNNFNAGNFSDCNLGITVNSDVSASKSQVFVTGSVDLSTVKGDLFTFYYLNTGSLILGFSPKSKPLTTPGSAVTVSVPPSTVLITPPVHESFIDTEEFYGSAFNYLDIEDNTRRIDGGLGLSLLVGFLYNEK